VPASTGGLLLDVADSGAQDVTGPLVEGPTGEVDRPRLGFVEALEQGEQRRLTRPGGADDRGDSAGADVKGDVAQDRRTVIAIGKGHMLEGDQRSLTVKAAKS
jgi:hypothetical protein